MKKDFKILLDSNKFKLIKSLKLLQASFDKIVPYDNNKNYSPEESEPYDALSDRFSRAIEISIKFFRSYELFLFGENSDTLRDLLNTMNKLELITSVGLWIEMRNVRNRIVHDYLPEEIKQLFDSILLEYAQELIRLSEKIIKIDTED